MTQSGAQSTQKQTQHRHTNTHTDYPRKTKKTTSMLTGESGEDGATSNAAISENREHTEEINANYMLPAARFRQKTR